jgi:hypothetical protein
VLRGGTRGFGSGAVHGSGSVLCAKAGVYQINQSRFIKYRDAPPRAIPARLSKLPPFSNWFNNNLHEQLQSFNVKFANFNFNSHNTHRYTTL